MSPTAVSSVRRRRRRGIGVLPGISASQYGQTFHFGSIGLRHESQGTFSLRAQLGQRR